MAADYDTPTCEQTPARSRTRTGILFNDFEFALANITIEVCTIRFKGVSDVTLLAFLDLERLTVDLVCTRLDSASIYDYGRPVVPQRGHQSTRHILVASGDEHAGVVVLCFYYHLE